MSPKFAIIICIVLALSSFAASIARPQRSDDSSIEEKLKYLQELDNIYSSINRPRLIRSGAPLGEPLQQELVTAIGLLRLETLDRIYSKHSRPRFGKRSAELLEMLKDVQQDQQKLHQDQEDNKLESNYFRR